jgi:peptide subunit release factor 1 (eRF1)
MTVRYEYKSACCGHEYVEQRRAEEPMWFTTCNACGNADYELVNQTVLAETVERVAGPESVIVIPAEEPAAITTSTEAAPTA